MVAHFAETYSPAVTNKLISWEEIKMSLRFLIFLELLWLSFCGFWMFIAILFSSEQPAADFLWNCIWFLLVFLVIGVGPLALTISWECRTQTKTN